MTLQSRSAREILRGALEPDALGVVDPGAEETDARGTENVPSSIGPYRVLRRLGRGGMGHVYLGVQESPQRRVAIKLVRREAMSDRARRRILHEAEVLARLDHPSIARVYEVGLVSLEGSEQPYIVMEYVEGRTLREILEGEPPSRVASLDLFLRLCDAVEHAHRRGVIHRDLSTSNIIVDGDGVPKIVDFGVARDVDLASHPAELVTGMGEILGTLDAMSPEQVAGDPEGIDTRTDVYALGSMLYRMLAGRDPIEFRSMSLAAAIRAIEADTPTPLSKVDPSLRGDLETIVGKALRKEKDRRYQTIHEMASDIRRSLRREPILARRPTVGYVVSRFAMRNKGLVVAVVIAVVSLLVGFAFSSWQAVAANSARHKQERLRTIAEQESMVAESITEYLVEMLRAPAPVHGGRDVRVVDLLNDAARRLVDEPPDDVRVAARLHHALGQSYLGLGLFDRAIEHLERATEGSDLDESRLGEALLARCDLGQAIYLRGDFDRAEEVLRAASSRSSRALGSLHQTSLEIDLCLATLHRDQGRHDQAVALARSIHERSIRSVGPRDLFTLNTAAALGVILRHAGMSDEAERHLQATLDGLLSDESTDDEPEVANMRRDLLAETSFSLGNHLIGMGRHSEARAHIRRALSIHREYLGPDDLRVIREEFALASIEAEQGECDGLDAELRRVNREFTRAIGPDHPIAQRYTRRTIEMLIRCGHAGAVVDVFDDVRHASVDAITIADAATLAISLLCADGHEAELERLIESVASRGGSWPARTEHAETWLRAAECLLVAERHELAREFLAVVGDSIEAASPLEDRLKRLEVRLGDRD